MPRKNNSNSKECCTCNKIVTDSTSGWGAQFANNHFYFQEFHNMSTFGKSNKKLKHTLNNEFDSLSVFDDDDNDVFNFDDTDLITNEHDIVNERTEGIPTDISVNSYKDFNIDDNKDIVMGNDELSLIEKIVDETIDETYLDTIEIQSISTVLVDDKSDIRQEISFPKDIMYCV